MKNQDKKLFQKDLVLVALRQSFIKLNPASLIKNPVMFTVEVGTAVMLVVCLWILTGETGQGSFAYNLAIFLVLFFTLLFANLD
jgi:K+-transporting ATPase ATPase B chain